MLSILLYFYCICKCFALNSYDSESDNSRNSEVEISGSQLKHVHLLFRHGDRSPMCFHALSSEPFSRLWPAGRGQLTDLGIVQEFQLGQWIRGQYPELFNQVYNASKYHIRSTDIDRTLMSAEAFTQGLYEFEKSPLEKFNISWRPIPVHTVKAERDILLSAPNCPLLMKLQKAQMNSRQSVDFEQNHSALFKIVNEHMSSAHFDRTSIWEVQDASVCMRAHNATMSEWLTPTLLKEMDEVAQFYWVQSYASTSTILRLEIGVFLHTMLEHMSAVAEGRTPRIAEGHHLSTQHVMAYSAHDTDVTYLLAAFGVYDQQVIKYSSAVVFELLEPESSAASSKHLFRMRYKRGWEDTAGEYLLPSVCKDYEAVKGCPLDVLKHGMQSMLLAPEDFKAACSLDAAPTNYLVSGLSVVIVILSIVCITLSVVAVRLYRVQRGFTFERFDQEV